MNDKGNNKDETSSDKPREKGTWDETPTEHNNSTENKAEGSEASTATATAVKSKARTVDRSVVMSDALRSVATQCLRILIVVATIFVVWKTLGQFWHGVLPIILALILCTVLAGPSGWLRRRGLPNALAAALSLLAFVILLGSVFWFVAPQVINQSQSLYAQAIDGIFQLQLWLTQGPLDLDESDINNIFGEVIGWLQSSAGDIAGGIFAGISTATSMILSLVVIVLLTFFFLKDGHRFLPWLRTVTGRRQGWHLTELLTRSWNTLGGYIKAQALVSLIDAVFIGTGLVIIGVPMPFALAVITFFAGFIPLVGAIAAGALAVLIALVSVGFPAALATLAVVILVQQLEGNVLSPILQSRAMSIHPVIVLVSVTVGGSLFGIIGAFLAVPVAAMIAVAFRYGQELLMLRSGEKSTTDFTYATKAGVTVAEFTESEGEREREELNQPVFLGGQDIDKAEAEASEAPLNPNQDDPTSLKSRISGATSTFSRRFSRGDTD